jgi:hypothetical protein
MGPSGGPITRDTTGAEHYGTIFAFVESPHERGVFWCGSDDGLLHLSRDNGATWTNITPPDLPEWTVISMLEVSPHHPATAYMVGTRYKLDDFQPYLYKTQNYGATWQRISDGLPVHDFTRVIREDPHRRGLLYVGTETGLYMSLDDGASWQSLRGNLPVVPIYDLVIKDNDLVVATHGRSFWILDDLTPLYQYTNQVASAPVHLYTPRPTYRSVPLGWARPSGPGKYYTLALGYPATFTETTTDTGETIRTMLDAGTNPDTGVVVTYALQQPADAVRLRFLEAQGQLVSEFSSQTPPVPSATTPSRTPRVAREAGVHRFVWNMRYPDAHAVPGDKSTERNLTGPLAPPGTYQVELYAGGQTVRTPFEIRKDPRLAASQQDFAAQFALLLQIRDKLSATHDAINQMRSVRQQVQEWGRRTEKHAVAATMAAASQELLHTLAAIEQELIEPRVQAPLDMEHYPTRLNIKLASLTSVVASADTAPTQQAYDVFADLSARIDRQLARWQELLAKDISTFNTLVRNADIPAVVP